MSDGARRDLDLEPDSHRTDGEWALDVDRAYNPTCASADAYECPLPPTENWLDVDVEARARDYEGPGGHGSEHEHGH